LAFGQNSVFGIFIKDLFRTVMKKYTGIFFLLMTLLADAQHSPHALLNKQFTPEQLQEDFKLFRTALEKIHPGLYRYTTRKEMDSIFDVTYKRLYQPLTYGNFYKLLALVNSQIRCQHTAVAPKDEDMKYISKYGKMFPYEIMWDFDPIKAYAFSDVTNEGGIKPATEIAKINGRPVQEIYDTLMTYLFSDGYNLTSKQVRLVPFDFQHWYYLFIERPDTFEMEFLINGSIVKKNVAALTIDEYQENGKRYRLSNDPDVKRLIKHYIPQQRLKPYRLEFLNKSTTLLTLREYGSLEFFEQSFKKIKDKKTENLIIDVRQNGGGWDDFGFKLFSYLIKKPTRYYDSLYTPVTDIDFLMKHTDKDSVWLKASENVWWKNGKPLSNSISEGLSLQQPQRNRFEGNVYVLLNGKSMSTTAEFTAATHYNKLATFVGEESGGAYEGGNGADFVSVILPNTQLFVNIPLAKYVMATSGEPKGRGTIPHYEIKKTVKDWLELRDPQLEFVLELINKETR
jgi:hypothetical protein